MLNTLDRTHDPANVPRAVADARGAGFDQVSLDLIYGTPGESLSDWETSVEAALACAPDHLSAYSLIVEEGTALARRVKRGDLPMPDEDRWCACCSARGEGAASAASPSRGFIPEEGPLPAAIAPTGVRRGAG